MLNKVENTSTPVVNNGQAQQILLNVKGKKVGLGPWLPEHMAGWLRAFQDPELNLYAAGQFLLPSGEHEQEKLDLVKKQGGVFFAIHDLETLQVIGNSGLFRVDHRNQTAYVGIAIFNKELWGKGFGSEALKLVMDYGFKFYNLHTITLFTTSYNQRAIRAYEKCGFKVMGRRREAILVAGKRYDEVFMDCLASDFVPPAPGWFELGAE